MGKKILAFGDIEAENNKFLSPSKSKVFRRSRENISI